MLLHVLDEIVGKSSSSDNTELSSRGFWWPLLEHTNFLHAVVWENKQKLKQLPAL